MKETDMDPFADAISPTNILEGFGMYYATVVEIVRLRGQFAKRRLELFCVSKALKIFLYSVAISFVIYIPIILHKKLELDKISFLLQFLYGQLLLVLVVHLALRAFRGTAPIGRTFVAYCIWVSFSGPLMLICSFPMLWYLSPTDFIDTSHAPTAAVPAWAMIFGFATFAIIVIFGAPIVARWLADVQGISLLRTFAAFVLIAFPVLALHSVFVAPYVTRGIQILAGAIKQLI
ncbi:MAG TPA: hypothetical protein VHQ90_22500 [Thermoanaerobaculia bacterium]|nr:hypothetical protein [Thermoanaerobaculia bacterium]